MPPRIDIATRTHTGLVRGSNQDAVIALVPSVAPAGIDAVVAVADGMGGLPAGEVASALSMDAFRTAIERRGPISRLSQVLVQAMNDANRSVWEDARSNPSHRGMGTTMTAALVSGNRLLIGHVGDSRAYLLGEQGLRRLTVDHTWVQEGIDAGMLSPEEAATHPYRNMLTRALGLGPEVDVLVIEEPLKPGDSVLVCSDGLHGEVDDSLIAEALAIPTPEAAAAALEGLALARGGSDNITIGIIKLTK